MNGRTPVVLATALAVLDAAVVLMSCGGAAHVRSRSASLDPRRPSPEVLRVPSTLTVASARRPSAGHVHGARTSARARTNDGGTEHAAGPHPILDAGAARLVAVWWRAYATWELRPAAAGARHALARTSTGGLFATLIADPPRRSWIKPLMAPIASLRLYRDRSGLQAILEVGTGPLAEALTLRLTPTSSGTRVAALEV